jgi:excinuclease ABC subunit C
LLTIQKKYQLKKFPYRIECIDISHLSGWRVSGGLSCLLGGIKYFHWYRRYKIKATKGDDYESLKELLERREKNGWELPDLMILDGGKGQLWIVKKLCKEHPERKKILTQRDIIALGKGEARNKSKIWAKSTKGLVSEKIYQLDTKLAIHEQALTYDQADKILLQARDEAHRFANSYRKKQMSQEFKH